MKATLIATLAVLFTTSTMAEFSSYTKATRKTSRSSKRRMASKARTEKKIEKSESEASVNDALIQLGSLSGDLGSTESSDNSSDSTVKIGGLGLTIGTIFNINENFETTTLLGLRSLSIDKNETNSILTNLSYIDATISQKFSFVANVGESMKIKPFASAGIGYGLRELNIQITDEDDNNLNGNITQNYVAFSYAAGLEVEFSNGLTPFVQYQVSTLGFSDEVTFEGTVNGQSVTETDTADSVNEETKTLMIGLGYRF